MLEVALVGTGGMMPLPNRFLSSMLCRAEGSLILADCGEGTQVSLKLLGWGYKNIDVICFTHFHADHISGLPGLLLAVGNAGRTEPLRLYGPPGLPHVVKCLSVIAPDLPFPLVCHEWNPKIVNTAEIGADLTLGACLADHGLPCFAYSLVLKRRGRFDPERAKAAGIPLQIWSALQKQNDAEIVYNGVRYNSGMVLGPPRRGLKVVFCTDSRPTGALAAFAKDADLFICEGMHGEADKQDKTARYKHMTYAEAAGLAKEAGAGELWLTHFSPAMPDPRRFLPAAADIFPNTAAGRDRMTKTLKFAEES